MIWRMHGTGLGSTSILTSKADILEVKSKTRVAALGLFLYLKRSKFSLSPTTTNYTYTQIMASLYDLQLEPLYANIQCPVLFMPAAKHRFFEWKNQFIQRIISDLPFPSRSVIIPDTEHIMVFEHYEELSQVILSFLEQVDSNRLDS